MYTYLQIKRIVLLGLILFSITPLFGYEAQDLNGFWWDDYMYGHSQRKIILTEENPRWGRREYGYDIEINDDLTGSYFDGRHVGILDVIKVDNDTFLLKCFLDGEYQGDTKITFIDEDTFMIDGWTVGSGVVYEMPYHRVSSPAKIPVSDATLNDSQVRLRTKPNLDCDVWALLDSGYQVKIKDKSTEPQTIDGESWYWYKVESKGYPDGWIYGKYLDIKE